MKDDKELQVRKGVPFDLKKRNAWFDKLSAKNKRIEIMKEIIWALARGYFGASSGYFDMYGDDIRESKIGDEMQVEMEIDKKGECDNSCDGCEIAAILYARIRLGNKAKLLPEDIGCSAVARGRSQIYQLLEGIFSDKQLRLMECAYERDYLYMYSSDNHYSRRRGVVIFYDSVDQITGNVVLKYSNDSMIQIAENVIAHNGIFKPFDLEYLKQ